MEKLGIANVTRSRELSADVQYTSHDDCWRAWFDGAASPNPGRIGLGAVLLSPAGERHELSTLAGQSGCNNEAELLALMAVLELALKAGATKIQLRGDSNFAIGAGQARLSPGAPVVTAVPRLVVLITRLNALLNRFEAVMLGWIPRHRNGEADRLSRQALGLPHKPAAVPGKKLRSRRRRV